MQTAVILFPSLFRGEMWNNVLKYSDHTTDWKIVVGFSAGSKTILFTSTSRTAQESAQTSIQWGQGLFLMVESQDYGKLITHFRSVTRLKIYGAISALSIRLILWCQMYRNKFIFIFKLPVAAPSKSLPTHCS